METHKNGKSGGGKRLSPKEVGNLDFMSGWEALEKRLNEIEKKPSYRIRNWLAARQERSFYHTVSSLGAGLLGLGLGILFGRWLGNWTSFLLAGGMVLLGWGIYMLHYTKKLWWLRLPKWLQLLIVVGYGVTSTLLAWLLENIFHQ